MVLALKDKYPAAKKYYDRHYALRKRAPSGYTASTYSTVRVLLDTAREVKSLETDKVTRALEGRKFQYLKGPEQIRACDHVNIQDVYLCKGKSAAAMKDAWDFFDIVQSRGRRDDRRVLRGRGLRSEEAPEPADLTLFGYPLEIWYTQLFIGLVNGCILILVALGLSIVFGLMGIINFAHGVFYMLGAYAGWLTVQLTGSFWLALAVAPARGRPRRRPRGARRAQAHLRDQERELRRACS